MQKTILTPKVTVVFAVLLATCATVRAEDAATLQQKLESKYALTTINAEGGVVISGATLTLKKPGLTAGAKSCTLDYKGGALALSGTSKASCTAGKASGGFLGGIAKSRIPGLSSAPDAQGTRPFVSGEKLWVTKIAIAADLVSFSLVSDTINNVVYNAVIRFQPQPGATPDFAHADTMIGEVFTVTPPDNQAQGGQQAAQPASAPPEASSAAPAPSAAAPQDKLPDIAPPPPPPDQPAPTVALGQTIDQVVAILGQPSTVVDLGAKKIYNYKSPGVKVTFVDGKVTDMQ